MSRVLRPVTPLIGALILILVVRVAAAQANDPLERALTAYRSLDFDAAAERLRAALSPEARAPLSPGHRLRALMYLGATEQFRDRRAAAAEAFGLLVRSDPRYRPDELVFPPEVTALFAEVRLTIRAAAVIVPDSVSLSATSDRIPFQIHVTSPHDVRALMLDTRGIPLRLLHDGTITDSLVVDWNGRDPAGRLHDAGTYFLVVTSRGPDGIALRSLEIPLRAERFARDSLRLPVLDQTALRPETRAGERSWLPLAAGLVGAGVVAALPATVDGRGRGLSLRHVLSAALGVAGLVGYAGSGVPRPIPENVEWNRNLREQHRAETERVRVENERLRSEVRLRLRAGAAREIPAP